MRRWLVLALAAAALPAAAAYDLRGVALGAAESEVRRQFPNAHCKALEWASRAAERRCDDARVALGGVEVRVTFYLKKDAVEAFDVRFDVKDLDALAAYVKGRYGKPTSELREKLAGGGKKGREVYKAIWQGSGEQAVLAAQLERRTGSMLVSRGNFEEEIYRVR